MNTLSKEIAGTESQIQTIQDIYSISRNIYLDNSFEPISENYYRFDYKNRKLYALSEFLGSYPRFVIEAAAIVVIAGITTNFIFFIFRLKKNDPFFKHLLLLLKDYYHTSTNLCKLGRDKS